jgi:biotin transport system substrate-specific component
MKNVRKMVLASLFASLCAVCSWIALPIPPVYCTLQTLAVLLTLGTLGGRWGSASIGLYLLLGIVGLPVFAGFRGGIHALLDPTGGFLWGFLAGAAIYRLLERFGKVPGMLGALMMCYLCGCWWFTRYAGVRFGTAVLTCVVPYLAGDGIKLWLAWTVSRRLAKHI